MITLDQALFANLDGSVEGLRTSLQAAIELEHATIPPYLYALYSILPGKNAAARQIIHSVVVEEMLHMTIACNLLNAIGGTPCIDSPDFLPQYPGHLPHSVQSGLTVTLAPLSLDQVHNVFMQIEEPEHPLNFPVQAHAVLPPTTIGMFYKKISEQLKEEYFIPDTSRQVTAEWWNKSELFPVTNLHSAHRAIKVVVEQGEGTSTSPEDLSDAYAHYYRFAEIFHGKRLIKNPNAGPDTPPYQRYIYAGDSVPLDPSGIQPLVTDPAVAGYPAGSQAFILNNAFNATYTALLRSMQSVFTGNPRQLNTAIGIMESLKEQAIALTQVAVSTETFAGPTFEYRPVN